MDPEETKPSKSKRFLKIALGVLGILAVLLGTAYVLTALKNARQAELQALSNVTEATREPTEAEKLLQSQTTELDRVRARQQSTTSVSTTTLVSQTRILDALRSQTTLKQKTTTTTPKPIPKTLEQQTQELDALRATLSK